MGPRAFLGKRPEDREPHDQRALRDTHLEASVPRGLPEQAMPDPGRRFL